MPEDRSHDRRTIDLRRRNNAIFRLVNPTRQIQDGYTPQGTLTGIFTPTLRIEDLNRALGGPPAKPDLRVRYGLGFFTINWQITNANVYRFEMLIDGEWKVVNPDSQTRSSATFTNVTQTTIYTVRVIASNIQPNAGGTTISDPITLRTPRFDFIDPPVLLNTPIVEPTRSIVNFTPDIEIVSYDISSSPYVDISNINIIDTSATFTNLLPGTVYQFTIVGLSIIDVRSIPLIITIATPLAAPVVNVTTKTDTSITLDWTNNTGTSTYRYLINPGSVSTGTGNQKIFSSLLANTLYTGTVVATKSGFADVSSVPFQAITNLSKPVLTVHNATVNSITVKWVDNTGADPYVNNTTYFPNTTTVYTPYTFTISANNVIINPPRSGDSLTSTNITGRSGFIFEQTFNELTAGVIYTISVTAHSRYPNIVSVTSDSQQRATLLGQFDISLNLVTANSFRVRWAAFAGPTTVAFTQLSPITNILSTPVIVNVPGSSGFADFSGTANTRYDISASAIASTNAPVFSNILSVFTAPAGFTIARSTIPVTSTSFTITWPNITLPGNSTGLIYNYSPVTTMITDTSATTNYATFLNLTPNTVYFPVVTVKNFSDVSASSINALSITTAPATPFTIVASAITSNSCIVSFPNIPNVTYPSCTFIPSGAIVNIVGNIATITGLISNTNYDISATATNASGVQVPSSVISITTSLQTLIISKGAVTNNSITVEWIQPPGNIPLIYTGNLPNYTYTASSMTFTGLSPGVSYSIIVSVGTENSLEVTSNTLDIFTALTPPDITTSTVSNNKIQVTWSNYTGQYNTTKQLLNGSNVTNLNGNYTTTWGTSFLTSNFFNLTDNTYYNIILAISNTVNGLTDATSNTVQEMTAPLAPIISSSNIGTSSFTITATNSGSNINPLTYRYDLFPPTSNAVPVSGNTSVVSFTGLDPETSYTVVAYAQNASLIDVSSSIVVQTLAGGFNIRRANISQTGYSLTWPYIAGYTYLITPTPSAPPTLSAPRSSVTYSGLSPNTSQTVTIVQQSGSGDLSAQLVMITSPATFSLTSSNILATEFRVNFPIITGITYPTNKISISPQQGRPRYDASGVRFTGLNANSPYTVTVFASNYGLDISASIQVNTGIAPFILTPTITSNSIRVSWPTIPNATFTYALNDVPISISGATSDVSAATFSNLTSNTNYAVTVTAMNLNGVSTSSRLSRFITGQLLVTAPAPFSISGSTITPQSFNVALPVISGITYPLSGISISPASGLGGISVTSNLVTFSQLNPDTFYNVTVNARNNSNVDTSANTIVKTIAGTFILTKTLTAAGFDISFNPVPNATYVITKNNPTTILVLDNSTTGLLKYSAQPNSTTTITITATTTLASVTTPITVITPPIPYAITPYSLNSSQIVIQSPIIKGNPSTFTPNVNYTYSSEPPLVWTSNDIADRGSATAESNLLYTIRANAINGSGVDVFSYIQITTPLSEFNNPTISYVDTSSSIVSWTPFTGLTDINFTFIGLTPTLYDIFSASFSGLVPNTTYPLRINASNNANLYYPSLTSAITAPFTIITEPGNFSITAGLVNTTTFIVYYPVNTTNTVLSYSFFNSSTLLASTNIDTSSNIIISLFPNTSYIIRARIENSSGKNKLSTNTLPIITKLVPFSLSINTNLHNSYIISWQNIGTAAVNYIFTINGSTVIPNSTSYGVTNTATFSTGVSQNILYIATVTANNGSVAGTVTSPPLSVTTKPAPITLTLSNITNILTTGFVMTLPTVTGNGFIYSYDISGAGGSFNIINTNSVQFLGAAGSSYAVRVTASNNSGIPVISNYLTVITAYAPIVLSRGTITQTSFTVTWTALNFVLSYAFTSNGSPIIPTSSTASSATFAGIPNNSYNIVMTVTNNSFIATTSSALLMTTAPASFDIPTNPYNISTTDFYLPLPPVTAGVSYTYISVPTSTITYDASSARFAQLSANTTYILTGIAKNASAVDISSNQILSVITKVAPFTLSINTNLHNSYTISWQNSGTTAINYTFTVNGSALVPDSTAFGATNTATFSTGVTQNTLYAVTVTANNGSVAGTVTSPLLSITTRPAPITLTMNNITNIISTGFVMTLPTVTGNGFIYSYDISGAGGSFNIINTNSVQFLGAAGSSYTVKATASNNSGIPVISNTLTVITAYAPFTLSRGTITQTEFTVTWAALNFVSIYAFTSYGTEIIRTSSTATSATFAGTPNTSYNIVMTATNNSNIATSSSALLMTTAPAPFNIPTNPYNISTTDFYLPLPVTAGVTYTYTFVPTRTITYDASSARFSGLSANTTYIITGRANNASGVETNSTNYLEVITAYGPFTLSLISQVDLRYSNPPESAIRTRVSWPGGTNTSTYTFIANESIITPSNNPATDYVGDFKTLTPNTAYSLVLRVTNTSGAISTSSPLLFTTPPAYFDISGLSPYNITTTEFYLPRPVTAGVTYTFTSSLTSTITYDASSARFSGLIASIISSISGFADNASGVQIISNQQLVVITANAPFSLTKGTVTQTSYSITWPTLNYIAGPSSYTFRDTGTLITPTSLTATSATFAGTANTTYNITLTVINTSGAVTTSTPSLSILTAPAPFNISGLSPYNISATNFYLPLSVTTDISYTYISSPASTVTYDTSAARFTDISANTTYTITGYANNASGVQTTSSDTRSVLSAHAPFDLSRGVPPNYSYTYKVTWTELSNVSTYTFRNAGSPITPTSSTSTSATFDGTPNTTYYITLTVTNTSGGVTTSSILTILTAPAPFSIAGISPYNIGSAEFYLPLPFTSGVTYRYYDYDANPSVVITHDSSSARFTNLTASTTYTIAAFGNNDGGVNRFSNDAALSSDTKSVTTESDQVTGLTTGVGFTDGYITDINPRSNSAPAVNLYIPESLTQNPRFIGTSSLSDYVLYINGVQDRIIPLITFSTNAVDDNNPTRRYLTTFAFLSYNTSYSFTIAARNTAGFTGTQSTPAIFYPILPSAPTSVSATAGVGQITVSWAAPSSTGSGSIGSYMVLYKTSSATTYTSVNNGLSLSRVITGLSSNTTYNVHVYAINNVGHGPVSAQVSATIVGDPMILLFNATNIAVTLPMVGNAGKVSVDYGDGNATSSFSGLITNTRVKVYGEVTRFGSTSNSGFRNNFLGIENFGSNTLLTSLELAYFACEQANTAPNTLPSSVTNLNSMFLLARIFNSANISSWNTSAVTDMSSMFSQTTFFNQPLSWTTTAVKNMSYMFQGALRFNGALPWDPVAVTDMSYMFQQAPAFNQPLTWNTISVTNMRNMFDSASSFNKTVSFNTTNVTNMQSMFAFTYKFNNGDTPFSSNIPLNFNTGKVTNMSNMFINARVFDQTLTSGSPIHWNTSAVLNMNSMFAGASAFRRPLVWNTSSVTDMGYMFWQARSFNQPLAWNVENVVEFTLMFSGAVSFNQSLTSWNTPRAFYIEQMFAGATALYTSNNYNHNLAGWSTANLQEFAFVNGFFQPRYLNNNEQTDRRLYDSINDKTYSDVKSPFTALTLVPRTPTLGFLDNGRGTIEFTWSIQNNKGPPITQYEISCTGRANIFTNWGQNYVNYGVYKIGGFTDGNPVTIAVRAINKNGAGAWSNSRTTSLTQFPEIARVPDRPQFVYGVTGNTTLTLTWMAPDYNGGSPVTSYEVKKDVNSAYITNAGTFDNATKIWTYTFTGLTNGVVVQPFIRAVNSVGFSAVIDTGTFLYPSTVPSAPTSFTGTASSGKITYTWTAPNNGGSAINYYEITINSSPYFATGEYNLPIAILQNNEGNAAQDVNKTSFTYENLTSGTYSANVRAVNKNGAGPVSSGFTITI